jgi:hypothetical protein
LFFWRHLRKTSKDALCTGYPDRQRRNDLARCGSSPWNGYLLRIRLRRNKIDEEAKVFTLGGKTFHEGDWISLDGSTGNIYGEAIKTVEASIAEISIP